MKIVEQMAKSIIVKSKLPDADLVVNPYTGCSFACSYCYASFMGRFVGEPIESWGSYLYVKTNAVEPFRRELSRMSPRLRRSTLLMSSVTDAWQGPEKKYRLARGILQILAEQRYPGRVSILTKSPLVLEDLPAIASLPSPDVGVTVTTTDDAISRAFEMQAPLASSRFRILKELNVAGVPTYAFVGPLFSHFRFMPGSLERLFAEIAAAGTREVYVEHLNLSKYIRKRLDHVMLGAAPDFASAYRAADEREHRRALELMVQKLIPQYGLKLRLSQVLDHRLDAKRSTAK